MVECVKIKSLLSRYLDKEISQADMASVERHLEECPACRGELAALARIRQAIAGEGRKSLPPDYLVGILRGRIADERRADERRLLRLAGIGELSRRLIPVPAAVIILSVVFLFLSSSSSISGYSLEEHLLNGGQTTTDMALRLMLGV
jgi:predicted anti-sigma-YlaC factor YlaD